MNDFTPKPADYIEQVEQALAEDIGEGDITSNAIIPADSTATVVMRAREEIVVAGLFVVEAVFDILANKTDKNITTTRLIAEGDRLKPNAKIMEISGSARVILAGERVALNFLQHMSAIATNTRKYSDAIAGTDAKILDTRKTTPLHRTLEKYAVRVGGGYNHRMRLDDMMLIKDNHIAFCGGISEAVKLAKNNAAQDIKIEIECDTLEQVSEATQTKADIIMLDNMNPTEIEQAIEIVKNSNSTAKLEASGNISLATVRSIANTGVDYISVGRLTHSAGNTDIGLDFITND